MPCEIAWLVRGAQSACFYYVSCTPWYNYRHLRQQRRDARAETIVRDKYEKEHPDVMVYRQPEAQTTNPFWAAEIRAGPGGAHLYSKKAEKKLVELERQRDEIIAKQEEAQRLARRATEKQEVASKQNDAESLTHLQRVKASIIERQIEAIRLTALDNQEVRLFQKKPKAAPAVRTATVLSSEDLGSDGTVVHHAPKTDENSGGHRPWYEYFDETPESRYYQRPDEELWGITMAPVEPPPSTTSTPPRSPSKKTTKTKTASLTSTCGTMIGQKRREAAIARTMVAPVDFRTPSDKYYFARAPQLNEHHPPISGHPIHSACANAQWMLQPLPSAAVMEGKERVR